MRTPCDLDQVLDHHGQAAEPARRRGTGHDPSGMIARTLRAQRRDGVHQRIDQASIRARAASISSSGDTSPARSSRLASRADRPRERAHG